MFVFVLRFVRALLCAVSLTLIGAGMHEFETKSVVSGEAREWCQSKHAQPVLELSVRVGSTCPLVIVVQAGCARAGVPDRVAAPFEIEEKVDSAWYADARDPERLSRVVNPPGVVRLLI